MSVINQMLQDLQSRNVKTIDADSPTTEEIQVPKVDFSWQAVLSKGRIEKGILVFLVLIFSIVVFRFFFFHEKPVPNATAPLQQATLLPIAQLIELKNITLKKENAYTSVIFSFDQPTTYRLEQNATQGTVTVFFKNIKLTAPLPTELAESAIENMQTSAINSETGITITLKKDSSVLGLVSQANDEKNIVLNLSDNDLAKNSSEIAKTVEPVDNKQLAERAYNQSLLVLNEGNIKEAIHQLQESLILQPDYLPSQQALVTLLLQQKEIDLAEKYLDQALNQRPQNVSLLQLKARMQLIANNPNAALHTLQSFSPPLAGNTDYYALIAAIHQQLKNFDLAAQLYRQIVMVQPNEGKWWVGLGAALDAQQQTNAAQEAYQRAAMLHTLDPNLQAFVDSRLSVTNNN